MAKKNGDDLVLVVMDGDDLACLNLPPPAVRVIRHLLAENEELRRQIAQMEGPPEPKKRIYKKRDKTPVDPRWDNGGDVAVVAEEGSP